MTTFKISPGEGEMSESPSQVTTTNKHFLSVLSLYITHQKRLVFFLSTAQFICGERKNSKREMRRASTNVGWPTRQDWAFFLACAVSLSIFLAVGAFGWLYGGSRAVLACRGGRYQGGETPHEFGYGDYIPPEYQRKLQMERVAAELERNSLSPLRFLLRQLAPPSFRLVPLQPGDPSSGTSTNTAEEGECVVSWYYGDGLLQWEPSVRVPLMEVGRAEVERGGSRGGRVVLLLLSHLPDIGDAVPLHFAYTSGTGINHRATADDITEKVIALKEGRLPRDQFVWEEDHSLVWLGIGIVLGLIGALGYVGLFLYVAATLARAFYHDLGRRVIVDSAITVDKKTQ
ncbi:hypothetical protein QOT17_005953 [Balamuthia mandrillaris]